jgi:hypothetical protein
MIQLTIQQSRVGRVGLESKHLTISRMILVSVTGSVSMHAGDCGILAWNHSIIVSGPIGNWKRRNR